MMMKVKSSARLFINIVPVIDLHLSRLGSTLTPLKKALSIINSTASQFIEQMVNPNRFYTYAYLREDKTPYYIGKGQGKRRHQTNGKPCNKPPKDRIIFLKKNLTEEEAFKHEIYMIAVFGRKDLGTGILHNRTDGGDGSSGWVPSEEIRKKISEANKNPSEETRRKMSEARIKNGCTLTEEGRETMKKLGLKNKKESRGIFGQTPEQRSENGRKNALICKEKGAGIFSLSSEQLSENSKKSNSQKWMCTETEFITTAGALSRYQNKRGIDTHKRKRVT